MITKEDAREIYNHYTQIENTEKGIKQMEQYIEKCKKMELPSDVIPDKYSFAGSVRIEIPQWMNGRPDLSSSFSSCTIYNISMPDAVEVLKNHVKKLKKELEEMIYKAEE